MIDLVIPPPLLALPIPEALELLRSEPMRLFGPNPFHHFAHRVLGLEGEPLAQWVRRAVWGHVAGQLTLFHLKEGKWAWVEQLIAPETFAFLRNHRPTGQGVVLVGGHVGPGSVVRTLLARQNLPVLELLAHEPSRLDTPLTMRAQNEGERRLFLTKAMLHVRTGGIVYMAPDERFGTCKVAVPFLGRQVALPMGLPRLLRVTQAPAILLLALWYRGRIQLFQQPLNPPGNTPDWERDWLITYLSHLEFIVRSTPENIRMDEGVWSLLVPPRQAGPVPEPFPVESRL